MAAGRVLVNGEPATELGTQVDPERDRVELDGERVVLALPRWIAFHKPVGVVTTANDPEGRPTVYDALEGAGEGLRYVGRLDLLTEGLIVMTNEGGALHRLTHPSFEVEREYLATLDTPAPDVPKRLVSGVELMDGPARAVRASWERPEKGILRLVLAEGRNREVRRMIAAVGSHVVRLQRVRYGPIELGRLPVGAWRELTGTEIAAVHRAVGGSDGHGPHTGGGR